MNDPSSASPNASPAASHETEAGLDNLPDITLTVGDTNVWRGTGDQVVVSPPGTDPEAINARVRAADELRAAVGSVATRRPG